MQTNVKKRDEMKIVQQFRARPLQTVLTILALALGVAAVTAIAAFINVSQREQTALTSSLWAREMTMQTRENDIYGATEDDGRLIHEVGRLGDEPIMLTEADMERARESAPLVDYAYVTSPVGIDMSNITKDGTDVLAVSKDYLAVNDITVSEGSSFADSDYTERRDVALVSPRLVKLMGLSSDPVGEHVVDAWGSINFEIIGVTGTNEDVKIPDVLIPFRPPSSDPFDFLSSNSIGPPTFVVEDVADVDEARAQLQAFASRTWGDRVTVRSQNVKKYTDQQRSTRVLIASLASIGLVSAALNIMNLLLARVFKNRRDTGILRTLGATRRMIRNQYLLDALVLGLIGGAIGVLLGHGLLIIFDAYVAAADPQATLVASPSPIPLLVGFVSALGISVVFSLYPALLASRLNVIESLQEL